MATNGTVKLYDSAGTTLATQTLDGNNSISHYGLVLVLFNPFPEVKLSEGQTYRLAVTNNGGILSGMEFPDMSYVDADCREVCFGPGQLTTRTDAGAWTDTSTKAAPIIPVMKFITPARYRYF